jgi:hypothetical protein
MVGIGYLEGCLFVGLERDLLREHHVPDREVTVGSETPDGDQRTMFAEFIDVHMSGTPNAVSLAAVGAHHFEMAISLVLSELRR